MRLTAFLFDPPRRAPHLYLHGNICHYPKSWCHGSPRVCCRRLAVHLLSLQLVPLVGTPDKDASKNREGDGYLALDGHCWVMRHTNQLIVGGSNRGMMERMRNRGGVYEGGVFLILGWQIE
jgi:hypothetical protein